MCTADCEKENNLTADCHEKNRITECHKENNRTADCYSQESKFESGLLRSYSCYGNAVHLRAVCQGVIPVVVNSDIGARYAT
jgi:hypothetical protein